MSESNLSPEMQTRLETLSRARGETQSQTIDRFGLEALRKGPRISPNFSILQAAQFKEIGLRDGLAYVVMPNGRIFYGHLSQKSHHKQYEFTKDCLDPRLTRETYLLALDVAVRYSDELNWPAPHILPDPGGTIIECGAFLGHKSIRFIDTVIGETGKLLAIEMMPDNFEILRRNVEENKLGHCIDIVHAGVWNAPGKHTIVGKGRQRNSLVPLDTLTNPLDITVPTLTLETCLNDWGRSPIDLVYMTINGAEYEGLQGAIPVLNKIKKLFVVAPYSRDGVPSIDRCKTLLSKLGITVEISGKGYHLIAAHP